MKNRKKLSGAALWIVAENDSYKLTDCEAVIEVFEQTRILTMPGSEKEYAVKGYSAALAICDNVKSENCKNIDVELLKTIRKFSLKFEPLEVRIDQCGVSVNAFENIVPVEIDLNGEWRFDITSHLKTVKGLFPDLIFC